MGRSHQTVLTQEFENHFLTPSWLTRWIWTPLVKIGCNPVHMFAFDVRVVRHTEFRATLSSSVHEAVATNQDYTSIGQDGYTILSTSQLEKCCSIHHTSASSFLPISVVGLSIKLQCPYWREGLHDYLITVLEMCCIHAPSQKGSWAAGKLTIKAPFLQSVHPVLKPEFL